MSRPSVADKRREFQRLHHSGCFVIPNPWDVGSARYLQSLGFKALATSSAGFAWSQGYADGSVPRERMLAHLHQIVDPTDVPVNADFGSGFAETPAQLEESVRLAVETGVAGLSIEDSTADPSQPLYDLATAVLRMRAARRAIDRSGGDTLLVGRAECFLVGQPDVQQTIARLKAYGQAGADCLYAPASRPATRSRRWCARSPPSRSICCSAIRVSLPWRTPLHSECGASASAARWRAVPGAVSCVPPG